MKEVKKEIDKLDIDTELRAKPFPFRHASARTVAGMLQNFYSTRYSENPPAQHEIRITSNDSNNTVLVQAAPADMAEIRQHLWLIDNDNNEAVNDLRIIPLRNARPRS